jgi:large subunit ribosomal protein L30e
VYSKHVIKSEQSKGKDIMIDVNKNLIAAVKTGKTVLGTNRSLKLAKTGKAKLLILAKNCPSEISEQIRFYAKLSNIQVYSFQGSSKDLGAACGKPFDVSSLAIEKPGSSDILKIIGASDVRQDSTNRQ